MYIYTHTHTHTHIYIYKSIYKPKYIYIQAKNLYWVHEKRKMNPDIMLKTVIKSQGKKAEKAKRKLWKQENNEQNNSKYISANNYFKCKWTNALIKRYIVADLIKKKHTHIYAANKRLTSNLKTHTDWKLGDGNRYLVKWKQKEGWCSNTCIRNVDFKTKTFVFC